jgi:hypothetical protein
MTITQAKRAHREIFRNTFYLSPGCLPQVAFGALVTFVCPFNARTPAAAPVNHLSSNIAR